MKHIPLSGKQGGCGRGGPSPASFRRAELCCKNLLSTRPVPDIPTQQRPLDWPGTSLPGTFSAHVSSPIPACSLWVTHILVTPPLGGRNKEEGWEELPLGLRALLQSSSSTPMSRALSVTSLLFRARGSFESRSLGLWNIWRS